jgi:hypothetical protein
MDKQHPAIIMRTIQLDPCEPGTKCADCQAPAAGLRPNLDREPSCRPCEADRLAMIEMLVAAAGDDDDEDPTPVQADLFGA